MNNKIKIGIVGCGAIGSEVSIFIEKELKDKAILWGVCDKDIKKAENLVSRLKTPPRICEIDGLLKNVDLIIECASIEAANYLLTRTLIFKKDLIILSVGALIGAKKILEKIEKYNVKIYVPSGAICGVDGIGALSLGKIKKITLVSSKPPTGFAQNKYLEKNNIDVTNIKKETTIFKGNVKQAIKCFPQNINVAATLSLASLYSNIDVYIKINPKIKRNIHFITVQSDTTRLTVSVENIPSKINPKTSNLAILSVKYLLKKIFFSFCVGS
ncbi:MAG: DUF108 domain-containing protein [Candidatus Omnitrophica bacterium]|nr:DUF108 domain-containing protein [Candidatus Omnitrophota bacterium]